MVQGYRTVVNQTCPSFFLNQEYLERNSNEESNLFHHMFNVYFLGFEYVKYNEIYS